MLYLRLPATTPGRQNLGKYECVENINRCVEIQIGRGVLKEIRVFLICRGCC